MKNIFTLLISTQLLFSSVFAGSVPDWTKTESKNGDSYTLSQVLADGNIVILDFFATWCGPCASSTPALESIWQDYGAGSGGLYIFGMDIDDSETDAQINNFKGNYGATYPSFAGCYKQYSYYNNLYGDNGIPLFILIYPTDSSDNEVKWSQVGWADFTENDIRDSLNALGYFPTTIKEKSLLSDVSNVSLYPNPASKNATITIEQKISSDMNITLYNIIGEKVQDIYNGYLLAGANKAIEINTSSLNSGLYFVRIEGKSGINVIKLIVQ